MRVLVTGANGFAGLHLLRYLQEVQPDASLYGTRYTLTENVPAGVEWITLDLCEEHTVHDVIGKIKPDVIYHLAAQSSPTRAKNAVWKTLETNIKMQFNLIDACLQIGIKPRILIISSGDVYDTRSADAMPLTETTALAPTNPYALSKAAQDMMGFQYFASHQLPIVIARPFNHTGPGQSESFVAPDFAIQIARIEAGLQEPIIRVGNLQALRDFSDVRDVVRAYCDLIEAGTPGEAYNIASGKAIRIQEILHTLLRFTDIDIDVKTDSAKLRPVDVPLIVGSSERIRRLSGWTTRISIEETLHDLLNDCRQRVQESARS